MYLDDRTLIASNSQLLSRAIDLWDRESRFLKLLEHPGKMQRAHRYYDGFDRGIEVLGVYLGDVPPELQLRARNRVDDARKCLSRIEHLPLGLWGRLVDAKVFALSEVLFGYVAHPPLKHEVRAFDQRLRRTAGKTGYACRDLMAIVGGANTQWVAVSVWNAVSLLRRVSRWSTILQFPARDWSLRRIVNTALAGFGWQPEGDGWTFRGFFFNLDTDPKLVGHALRESWRRWHYALMSVLTGQNFENWRRAARSVETKCLINGAPEKLVFRNPRPRVYSPTGSVSHYQVSKLGTRHLGGIGGPNVHQATHSVSRYQATHLELPVALSSYLLGPSSWPSLRRMARPLVARASRGLFPNRPPVELLSFFLGTRDEQSVSDALSHVLPDGGSRCFCIGGLFRLDEPFRP